LDQLLFLLRLEGKCSLLSIASILKALDAVAQNHPCEEEGVSWEQTSLL